MIRLRRLKQQRNDCAQYPATIYLLERLAIEDLDRLPARSVILVAGFILTMKALAWLGLELYNPERA